MNLNDLLNSKKIDPAKVLVLRHKPREPELAKNLAGVILKRPDLFNAYQQTQSKVLEKVMEKMIGSGYVASFVGHKDKVGKAHKVGKALFIGLYSIDGAERLTRGQYLKTKEYAELKSFGLGDFADENRDSILRFDLSLVNDFYESWKGKLIVEWPGLERSWWRHADRNEIPVCSILEDSALNPKISDWKDIILTWNELQILPSNLEYALEQWRGIYYIFDISAGKGYVGSASGKMNILDRWKDYAARGHGGNELLKMRDQNNFRFSILQRVSPDMIQEEISKIETTWKKRLHTRAPHGLNDN